MTADSTDRADSPAEAAEGPIEEAVPTRESSPGRESLPGRTSDFTGPFSSPLTPGAVSGVRSAASPSEMPVVSTFGRYEVLGRIALGGMAEIFLAREHLPAGVSRVLVIKKVLAHVADDDRFVSMFLDEARLGMKLSNPNICHIYEFGREEGAYFIAMEWVNGVPLGRAIKYTRRESGAGLPPPLAAKVIAATAEALDYAHNAVDETGKALGIVHRDVSPQNIMVSYDGGVKLLDFGIAKAASHDTKTSAGQVKGKYAYMSPGQCRGENIDGRADVFALGVCMYEALTARNLYRRPTEYESMRAIIEDPVPSARVIDSTIPEELDHILQKALAKSPEDRFQTAGDMQNALERWLADNAHVVNASVLSNFVGHLFPEERRRAPVTNSAPPPNFREANFRSSSEAPPPEPETEESSRSRSVVWALLFGAVLILGALGGLAYLLRDSFLPSSSPTTPPIADVSQAPEAPEWAPPEEGAPWESGEWAGEVGAEANPADPEQDPLAEAGAVQVTTSPAGATVRIGDEEVRQLSPFTFEGVPVGTHLVSIRKEGFRPVRQRVEVRAGETVELEIVLSDQPVRETGRLSINSRPWSRVFIGNRALGSTPIGNASVPAGTVRLRFVDRDGQTHNRTVMVRAGQHARHFIDLSSAPSPGN